MPPRQFRFQYSLATLVLLSFCCGGVMMWWHGRYARWAAELADRTKRNQAFFNLLEAQRYHEAPAFREDPLRTIAECKIEHVVISKQLYGPPVYAIFRDSTILNGSGRGAPRGHIIVIDGDGYILPWYAGANRIDSGDVFNVAPDEPVQCADCFYYTLPGKVLYVVPVSHDMTPLLLVAYLWDDDAGPPWSWNVSVQGNEVEIQLGPSVEGETRPIAPKVKYLWSKTERRYIGPDGGPEQRFMRLDPKRESDQMLQFFGQKKGKSSHSEAETRTGGSR